MFGSSKRLRERLEAEGRRAPGLVVQAEPTTTTKGPPGMTTAVKWKLRLRVSPVGESEFDVELADYFPTASPPNAGSTMDVLFDPADHSKCCAEVGSLVSARAPTGSPTEGVAQTEAELRTWSPQKPPSMRDLLKMRSQLRDVQLEQAKRGQPNLFATGVDAAPSDPERDGGPRATE